MLYLKSVTKKQISHIQSKGMLEDSKKRNLVPNFKKEKK